jgi:protein-disulfide isomerase
MTKEVKILISIAAVIIIGGGLLFFFGTPKAEAPGKAVDEKSLVRETSHSIGPSDAKVTIVEFGDYQCPACAQADPTMERIIDEYAKTGKIRFVFRHFPLSIHANAMPAAEAAEAAGSQGKYFEMHAKIYAGQPEWEKLTDPKQKFIEYASSLGLDTAKFEKEYSDQTHRDIIQTDADDGKNLGVNATPTFFINGEKKVAVIPYEELKKQIEELLSK